MSPQNFTNMPDTPEPPEQPKSLEELLQGSDIKLKDAFVKVMNVHAGHHIGKPLTPTELVESVRKAVEKSLE